MASSSSGWDFNSRSPSFFSISFRNWVITSGDTSLVFERCFCSDFRSLRISVSLGIIETVNVDSMFVEVVNGGLARGSIFCFREISLSSSGFIFINFLSVLFLCFLACIFLFTV